MEPTYLGDGVYVEKTEFGECKVYTSNGIGKKNIIYLPYEVRVVLREYLERFDKE